MMAKGDEYPKVWRCPRCKEALGMVIRDGNDVRRLVVGPATITGEARVSCECGGERLWVPAEENLAHILERLQKWHSNR
jgi:hypothetical protein